MSSYYRSLADFTADVARAVAAYACDMAVQDGWCAVCRKRACHTKSRRCWHCERHNYYETYPPGAPRD